VNTTLRNRDTAVQLAVCIRNEGSEDLELHKLYQVLTDEYAAQKGYLRVIDESGEDYVYPQDYFVLLELSQTVERAT
jgi:hypothetical protein